MQAAEPSLVEAGADLPGETKSFVPLITHQQRAEMLAAARRRGATADHKFLLLLKLELNPRSASSSALVNRIFSLGDETFQVEFAGLFEQMRGLSFQQSRIPEDRRNAFKEFFQQGFPRCQRFIL